MLPPRGRLRHVRIVRDYGMFDRREAPQYYAPVAEDLVGKLFVGVDHWRTG
jgi:hypothetical protein